jgi:hypothetical protein
VRREQRRRFVAQDHGPRLQRRPQFRFQPLARDPGLGAGCDPGTHGRHQRRGAAPALAGAPHVAAEF